ncbi:MAG: hypothetical protein SFV15_10625 [Polyangiaceae bacterium]|nr:hypothetical protein [Polyangiaceae bacterium]
MRLEVDIFLEDVIEILRDLSPLHLQMASGEGERRWLELQAPRADAVKLIAGEGIELRSRASLRYELSKVAVTAAVSEVVVMLRPTVLDSTLGARQPLFEVQLLRAELNAAPDACSGLAGAVQESLACVKQKLGWAFGEALCMRFQVSSGADLSALFLVRVQDRALTVSDSSIRLVVNFRGTFCRSDLQKASNSRKNTHQKERRGTRLETEPPFESAQGSAAGGAGRNSVTRSSR